MNKILLFLFFCLTVSTSLILTSSTEAQFGFNANPLIGERAPNFKLPDTEGNMVDFHQASEGTKSVIFLWATWCPHCRTQLKEINKEYEAIKKQGIQFFTVDLGEDPLKVQRYAQKHGIKMQMIVDQASTLSDKYYLIGVPTYIFVDEEGIVRNVAHKLPQNLKDVF